MGAIDTVRLSFDPSSLIALNVILAIPHYVVLFFYAITAIVVAVIGWFTVLFTGRWPQGMRYYLVRVSNDRCRAYLYTTMVNTSTRSSASLPPDTCGRPAIVSPRATQPGVRVWSPRQSGCA